MLGKIIFILIVVFAISLFSAPGVGDTAQAHTTELQTAPTDLPIEVGDFWWQDFAFLIIGYPLVTLSIGIAGVLIPRLFPDGVGLVRPTLSPRLLSQEDGQSKGKIIGRHLAGGAIVGVVWTIIVMEFILNPNKTGLEYLPHIAGWSVFFTIAATVLWTWSSPIIDSKILTKLIVTYTAQMLLLGIATQLLIFIEFYWVQPFRFYFLTTIFSIVGSVVGWFLIRSG